MSPYEDDANCDDGRAHRVDLHISSPPTRQGGFTHPPRQLGASRRSQDTEAVPRRYSASLLQRGSTRNPRQEVVAVVLPQHLDLGRAFPDREAVQEQSELDTWIRQPILVYIPIVDAGR